MDNKVSSLQVISLVLALLLCVMTLQGAYDFETRNLFVFGLWLITTVFAFPKELSTVLMQRRYIFLLMFLFFKFLCLHFNNPFSVSVNILVAYMCVLSPVLMYEIVFKRNRFVRGLFLFVSLAVLIINVVLSYQYLELTSAISMRGASELGEEFHIVEVAFHICYALTLLSPAITDIVTKRFLNDCRYKWVNYAMICVAGVFMLFILRAQFMTALIIAIAGILFAVFYRRKKYVRFILLTTSAIIIGLYILPIVVNTIETSSDYDFISVRLREISDITEGKASNASDFNERQDRSMMSFNTFLNNPIFGVGYKLNPKRHVQEQGIGNHAVWPDSLAEYGLFAFLLFYFLYDSLRRQSKNMNSLLTLLLLLALGFLNPFLYFPQMVTVFFIIPLLYQFFLFDKQNYR